MTCDHLHNVRENPRKSQNAKIQQSNECTQKEDDTSYLTLLVLVDEGPTARGRAVVELREPRKLHCEALCWP